MKSISVLSAVTAGLALAASATLLIAPAFAIVLGIAALSVLLLSGVKLSRAQFAVLALFAVVGSLSIAFGGSWVDVGVGLVIANAGAADVKAIEQMIETATKAVKATTDRMQQALDQAINDVKAKETVTSKTLDELKASSAAAITSQNAMKTAYDAAMQDVRQQLDNVKRGIGVGLGGPERKSWGQIVSESDNYKAAAEREKQSKGNKPEMGAVEVGSWHKTRILSSDVQTTTGTVPYMAQAERAPFVSGTERQLIVRSLLPVYSTESPLIEFCRENVFTNSAAPQGSGASPSADGEGQPKAESALTYTFVQQPIITIAHWIPASRQVLSDAKMLASEIEGRLRYGVLFEEEDEVINSSGANGELNGLWNQATAYDRNATADNRLDTLLKAFLQVTLSDYAADGVVMSHVDWTELLLLKDTTGRYLFGDPSSMKTPAVWGRPVVPTNSMTTGRFIAGAFQLAAALWDREQATVRIAEQHSDFFIRNMVVILAEERVALVVYRPAALVKGNFHVAGQPD